MCNMRTCTAIANNNNNIVYRFVPISIARYPTLVSPVFFIFFFYLFIHLCRRHEYHEKKHVSRFFLGGGWGFLSDYCRVHDDFFSLEKKKQKMWDKVTP